ncbi:unnamed protein product [Sphagnum troendelagicum]|uniref:Homeobox domain-containing protein n=1 Tax=Sphagnum troendelagicum TaxID=128251 RepID=A0ABP0TSF8_9BRYO
MIKFGNNNQIGNLNLVYKNNHFEPSNTVCEGTSSQNIESHEDVHLDCVDQTNNSNIFKEKTRNSKCVMMVQQRGGYEMNSSSSSAPPARQCPVQLDLLPGLRPASVTPAAAPSSTNNAFSWQPASLRNGSRTNSGSGGIDMNQLPSTTECDEEAVVSSSPSSCIGMKREREKNMLQQHDQLFEQLLDRERACDLSSRGCSDDEDGGGGGITRKKLRLSKEQSALLEESFKDHSTLNPKQKSALAKQLNLRPRQVEVWFQNRRARTKLKQTEVDREVLQRCCETLTEENRRLLKELQELRAIKVAAPCVIAHDYYMPLPAATLTMCPSCERVATVDNRSVTFSKPGYSHFSQSPAAC